MKKLGTWCDLELEAVELWPGAFEDALEEARRMGVNACWVVRVGDVCRVMFSRRQVMRDGIIRPLPVRPN